MTSSSPNPSSLSLRRPYISLIPTSMSPRKGWPTRHSQSSMVDVFGTKIALEVVISHTLQFSSLTPSGAETISHIYDNGRVTIMFCSFGAEARIVRLFGRGTVYEVFSCQPDLHSSGRKNSMLWCRRRNVFRPREQSSVSIFIKRRNPVDTAFQS
jgi:hypothetical protein